MAEKQPHKTKPKDRVRIKDTVTHMYPMARAYSEAIVRKCNHDELGYPMIYVEWDKDHWAYSGEEDRWVIESHFDKVEARKMDEKPDFMKALADLIAEYQAPDEDKEEKVQAQEPDPRPTKDMDYEDLLSKALNDAADGEAFLILVASPEEYQGGKIIVPHIYMHAKRNDAALLLDAATADLVAQSYSRLITDFMQATRDDEEPGA